MVHFVVPLYNTKMSLVRSVTLDTTSLPSKRQRVGSYTMPRASSTRSRGMRVYDRRRRARRAPPRMLGPTLSNYNTLRFDPFPAKIKVTLRYVAAIRMPAVTTAGTYSTYKFRANNIFDPSPLHISLILWQPEVGKKPENRRFSWF